MYNVMQIEIQDAITLEIDSISGPCVTNAIYMLVTYIVKKVDKIIARTTS